LSEIVTETTKIYPRGRGKVLVISEKSVIKKPKKGKDTGFMLFCLKSNPKPIIAKMYLDKNEQFFSVIYPEKRKMGLDDLDDVISGLLAFRNAKCRGYFSISRNKLTQLTHYVKHHQHRKGLVSQDLRNMTMRKLKRLENYYKKISES